MAKLKVTVDPDNKHVQIYGKYRYCTENSGGNLFSVSKRKHYSDMLSMNKGKMH